MGRYRRVTNSSQETVDIGAEFGKILPQGVVLLLFGDYGSGKTEFVRGVVQGYLGDALAQEVASPSFSLLHVYGNEPRRICHYDFYRIDAAKENQTDLFQDADEDDVLCVEWPESITLPQFREMIQVQIHLLTTEQREVSIDAPPSILLKLLKE
ncbi:tRNA (adenosine(37)-N6)-threonylcarbamoyltransferase complex ATPase subunit type 1 TsaE [Chlamydia psittaci]|uniref:tRNA (adenosine(37)-N6)-threonylcarbamoyltransferase complex ATPase subunit type 1 TsaE n=1 Tax=Chlamydia psittaci TaxID=83554 RepID=UPI000FCABF69|nr:tRNA (adenosine(37)-N6)-threonylcarbamoyltransferase complex ATPase subunit type 1 TsaE [Chlamydia psittaci]AZU11101.1 tRNA (adenosine(37)-N6)-threonylcarbamoyltransferase complex ATPase subunit type 1 TsaE [Chlamydia psittaci]